MYSSLNVASLIPFVLVCIVQTKCSLPFLILNMNEDGITSNAVLRLCIYELLNAYPPSEQLTCIPKEDGDRLVYALFNFTDPAEQVHFEADVCYCSSDLCNLDYDRIVQGTPPDDIGRGTTEDDSGQGTMTVSEGLLFVSLVVLTLLMYSDM